MEMEVTALIEQNGSRHSLAKRVAETINSCKMIEYNCPAYQGLLLDNGNRRLGRGVIVRIDESKHKMLVSKPVACVNDIADNNFYIASVKISAHGWKI
jgi:hypothetical protein